MIYFNFKHTYILDMEIFNKYFISYEAQNCK